MEAANPYAIRLGEHRDLPFLREMLFEAAFWRTGDPRPALDEALTRPDLAKLIEAWGRPGDTLVVAETPAGVGIGAGWFRFWSAESHSYGFVTPEIPELGLAVRSEHRRCGLGSRLLCALLEQAGQARIRQLSLSVEIENPAIRLYERSGFRRVGRVGGAWTMVADARR